jgi:type I restriction enzyme, S subunit
MRNKAKSTAMTNDGKPTLKPKLRFPEFRDAEGWEERQLEDVAPLQRGFDLPSDLIRPGTVPIVYSNGVQKYHEVGMATAPGLVTGRSGTIGKLHFIAEGDYWPHNTSLWVTDFKGNVPRFIYYLYDSIGMSRFSSGSGVPTLNRNDVHAFRFPVPEATSEQQKIADCLTSVDELISAQARKVDALKTHEKGLMQRLFPCEDETQPRLRFPQFQDAEEWVCEKLSSCLKKVIDYRGKAPPKFESGVPLITAKNVRFGWLDMTNDEYIEEDKYEEWMSRGIPQAGDILFTTEAPLGNVALFPRAGKFAVGQRLLTLRSKPEKCLPEFLFHSLLGPTMQEEIDSHSSGSTAKGIKSAVFLTLNFFYPKDIDEQRRIAGCFTTLNDLIAAQTQKLDALKAHKKGLMQQLFPSPEEAF